MRKLIAPLLLSTTFASTAMADGYQELDAKMFDCVKETIADSGYTDTQVEWIADGNNMPNMHGELGINNPSTGDYLSVYASTGAHSESSNGFISASVYEGQGESSHAIQRFYDASGFGMEGGTTHDVEGQAAKINLQKFLKCFRQPS